jgi:hypothetical protein
MSADFERLGALLALVQVAAQADVAPPPAGSAPLAAAPIIGCSHCELTVAPTGASSVQRSASSSSSSSVTSSGAFSGEHLTLVRHGAWLLAVNGAGTVAQSLRLVESTIAVAEQQQQQQHQSNSAATTTSSLAGVVNITAGKRVVSIRALAPSLMTEVASRSPSTPTVPSAALFAILDRTRTEAISELCRQYVARFRSLSKSAQELHETFKNETTV